MLKDGSIIEEGTHDELVKKGGYYSELVKLQVGDITEATEILSEKKGTKLPAEESRTKADPEAGMVPATEGGAVNG